MTPIVVVIHVFTCNVYMVGLVFTQCQLGQQWLMSVKLHECFKISFVLFTSWFITDLERIHYNWHQVIQNTYSKLSYSKSGSGCSSPLNVMFVLPQLMQSLFFEGVVKVPWKIFGPNTQETIREQRKPCSWDLYNLYSSPHVVNEVRWKRVRLVRHSMYG
jgi:hypothetical protein